MMDARTITQAIGGRWHGGYGIAACPVCQPERRRDQSALTLADGKAGLLAHCKKSDCDFREIVAALDLAPGTFTAPNPQEWREAEHQHVAEVEKRTAAAHRLWRDAEPIGGTLAERYLRGRGIICQLPGTLRFHRACCHPTGQYFPAMIAHVEGAEGFAVHRTYLRRDGRGKAAVEPAKAMLGTTRGGAVRLTEGQGPLVVVEGIETGLSLVSGLLDRPATLWAALSTSGMRSLKLPSVTDQITVASDGDTPGREAANVLAMRAHGLGWTVSLMTAPDGCDFNDVLAGKAVAA
jgi:hypothetical protein